MKTESVNAYSGTTGIRYSTPEEAKFNELLFDRKYVEALTFAARLVCEPEPRGVGISHLREALRYYEQSLKSKRD